MKMNLSINLNVCSGLSMSRRATISVRISFKVNLSDNRKV